MNQIYSLLLLELEAGSSSPRRLQSELAGWHLNLTVDQIVGHLRELEANGLVSGPGISRLHDHSVWLTSTGKKQLADLGDEFGAWQRVA